MTPEMEQIRLLAQEFGEDLAFIVNQSGGKDSTRMMGLVRKNFPYAPTYAAMANTGFEHIAPVTAATWAGTRCAEFGLDCEACLTEAPSTAFAPCRGAVLAGLIETATKTYVRLRLTTDLPSD